MAQKKPDKKSSAPLKGLAALSAFTVTESEEDKQAKEAAKQAERERLQLKLDTEKAALYDRAVRRSHTLTAAERQDGELRMKRIKEQKERMAREGVKRHFAKAAGVKSVFHLKSGELFMTAFGKGGDALPEKHVIGTVIETVAPLPAYSALFGEKTIAVAGRLGIRAQVGNPLESSKAPGADLIGLKSEIETEFFGQTFDDNIHIQLAHNIMDINKIMAVHINNIVYEINNMLRDETAEYYDIIGYLGLGKTWEKFSDPTTDDQKEVSALVQRLLKQPQLAYFGTVLYDPALIKKVKTARNDFQKKEAYAAIDEKKKEAYNLLTLLGALRQAMAHGDTENRAAIYTLDESLDAIAKKLNGGRVKQEQRIAARESLRRLYSAHVAKLNSGFLTNSRVDFRIIFSVFDAVLPEEKAPLVREYYDFVVRKEFKNQGFSFTRLRENMVLFTDARKLMDKTYDSVRGRLYRHFDFILYRHYAENPEEAEALLNRMRASMTGEEKEHNYQQEAVRLWSIVRDKVFEVLLPMVDGEEIKVIRDEKEDPDITPDILTGTALDLNANAFSQLVYLLTRFLDGKEINDLLTTMINKLDNIAALITVLKDRKIKLGFTDHYRLFGQSQTLAREIRAINSFARMDMKSDPDAKRALFVEAAKVLGYPGTDEQLLKYIDASLTATGEFAARGKDFRNFIASNVIESDRFKYLVRYCNVNKVRAIADNPVVISFVLKDIPDTQIVRYYNSCTGAVLKDATPEMRPELCKLITGIHFEDFAKVRTGLRASFSEKQDKARKQAIISLYLTVLYLTVKNLVYVNSRYSLAFHCLERDSAFAGKGKPEDLREYAIERVPLQYAEKANRRLPDHPVKNALEPTRATRVRGYMQQNILNSDAWAVRTFRNCAEHLNAVRNADRYIGDVKSFSSWFELYHYLMQRAIEDQYQHDSTTASTRTEGMIISAEQLTGKTLEYFAMVKKYGTYSKDFVKALNVPFAYNLPRYKNLSINELFDRNNYLPGKAEKV